MKGELIFTLEQPYFTRYLKCLSTDLDDIEFPEFQRHVIDEHVRDIASYQETFLREHGCFDFRDFIKLGVVNDSYYCVDGQHRLTAVKILSKIYKPFPVFIQVINYPSHEVMKQDFVLLHKSTPVSEYILEHGGTLKGQILKDVEAYFRTVYRNYIRDSHKVQKPHINLSQLLEDISERDWFTACKTSSQVIAYIESRNQNLRSEFSQDPELEKLEDKILSKSINGVCLYLSLAREWHFDKNQSKTRLLPTKEQRKRVWDLSSKSCYLCRDILSEKSFVCGHKTSHRNHGLVVVSNLVPMCVKCNCQLGSVNVE